MTSPLPRQRRPWILRGLPIVFWAAALALPLSVTAEGLSAMEAEKIEDLIAAVKHQTDAAFIRNNQAYDSTVAAEFLRRKWRAQAARVGSAEDFIEMVASFSSTSGRPYLIRFEDGREIACSVFLRAELAKLQRMPK
ncbi:MAG: hypothetical protein EHM15_08085 [Desulfobacteraceae bacterium]|nr:MAG: hypothetical protein EHM15_08085 [Desulfobacteraceae bacterium]